MREVELKAVVEDAGALRRRIERTGGRLTIEGRMVDVRFDRADGATAVLGARGEMLRVREEPGTGAFLAWKGPTASEGGYKVREEIATQVADAAAAREILERLGFREVGRIERDIAQYALGGATLRIERYPEMDVLVEVEGPPEEIERAIAAAGMSRDDFTSEPLAAFVRRYEARTGTRAKLRF